MHYQLQHTQGKLVRVVAGSVYDVAVDLRENSPSYGKWVGVELSAENHRQLWLPPGMAHGFLVLSESAEFLYKTTDFYHPESEVCLAWNDPTVSIQWPLPLGQLPNLNLKDAAGLSWEMAPKFQMAI
jgi:dTDP-4-dehydrorhamnose 3,5-epimerase